MQCSKEAATSTTTSRTSRSSLTPLFVVTGQVTHGALPLVLLKHQPAMPSSRTTLVPSAKLTGTLPASRYTLNLPQAQFSLHHRSCLPAVHFLRLPLPPHRSQPRALARHPLHCLLRSLLLHPCLHLRRPHLAHLAPGLTTHGEAGTPTMMSPLPHQLQVLQRPPSLVLYSTLSLCLLQPPTRQTLHRQL